MNFDVLAMLIAIPVLTYASLSDLECREVANELSFGLIAALLGLRCIEGVLTMNFNPIMWCCIAGCGFFLYGVLMFYAKAWGGADWKILCALGFGFATSPQIALVLFINVAIIAFVWEIGFAAFQRSFKEIPAVPSFLIALCASAAIGWQYVFSMIYF